jgi:predicted transglutaminase-like cysteine proteinase
VGNAPYVPGAPTPYGQQRKRGSTLIVITVVILAVLLVAIAALRPWEDGLDSSSGVKPGDPTYQWVYRGTTYTLDMNISKAVYQQYRQDSVQRYANDDAEAIQLADHYVTPTEDTIEILADKLTYASTDFTHLQRVSFVLSFVQSIEYVTDDVSVGQPEYWRYPVETLYDHEGDCEDKAFLFASIMEAMDYDAVILIYSDHAAAGVDVDARGSYYDYGGTKYYYCETTGTGWEVGDMPDEYDTAHVAPVG